MAPDCRHLLCERIGRSCSLATGRSRGCRPGLFARSIAPEILDVTFFRGTSLRLLPPGPSKTRGTRYADLHEGELDEAQMIVWVEQAAALPGWIP